MSLAQQVDALISSITSTKLEDPAVSRSETFKLLSPAQRRSSHGRYPSAIDQEPRRRLAKYGRCVAAVQHHKDVVELDLSGPARKVLQAQVVLCITTDCTHARVGLYF